MQCPSCKEPIDNDSRYCDQCGGQIKICPMCGKPGKGKFCTQDQTELVPAGAQAAPTAAPTVAPVQDVTVSVTSTMPAAPAMPVASPPVQSSPVFGSGDSVKFSGNGITFEAKDGDIIGRKAGAFANIFSSQKQVSGSHCKVVKISGAWHIQDLGSTNGTFAQGNKLAPNAPCPLSNNALVKIGILDFTVTFNSDADDNGATVRV